MNRDDRGKEVLGTEKLRQLFGEKFRDVIYYDYDRGVWIAPTDTDLRLSYPYNVGGMKKALEREPKLQNYELVAAATMTIQGKYYTGRKMVIKNPVLNPGGRTVVGNVVLRDKRTGNILPVASDWVTVAKFYMRQHALMHGFSMFVNNIAERSDYREVLVEANIRQR